jgi:hypothetical protein
MYWVVQHHHEGFLHLGGTYREERIRISTLLEVFEQRMMNYMKEFGILMTGYVHSNGYIH